MSEDLKTARQRASALIVCSEENECQRKFLEKADTFYRVGKAGKEQARRTETDRPPLLLKRREEIGLSYVPGRTLLR